MANYDTVVAPLTRLTKNNGFRWSKEATASKALKKVKVTLPILALSDSTFHLRLKLIHVVSGWDLCYRKTSSQLHISATNYPWQLR